MPVQRREVERVHGVRLTYVALLAFLALLLLASFGLLSRKLGSVDSNAAVLNISGRQRMLLARSALLAQLLDRSADADQTTAVRRQLEQTLELLEISHRALIEGRPQWSLPGDRPAGVSEIYYGRQRALDRRLRRFVVRVRRLASAEERDDRWRADLALITGDALGQLLDDLDEVVRLHQVSNEEAMRSILSLAKWTHFATLAVLLGSAVFVFYPMERRIEAQMIELDDLRRAQLDRSETGLRLLLDQVPAVLWTTDRDGRITSLRPPPAELVPLPCSTGCPVESCPLEELCLRRGGESPGTFDFRCADRYFQAAETRLGSSESDPGYTIGVALDVSKLRNADQEFRAARRIQERLYPSETPRIAGLDVRAATIPASAAGGDYYDLIPLGAGRLGTIVADVSGHGIGPALLMAETRAYLRSLARTEGDLEEIFRRTNAILAADTLPGLYVTLFFASLDPSAGALTYASAGHPTGYLLDRSGNVKATLPSTGIPLGLFPDSTYRRIRLDGLGVGDTLFVFTDGLCEAEDPAGEEFGVGNALAIVRRSSSRPAGSILDSLCGGIAEFVQDRPQADDITLLVARLADPEEDSPQLPTARQACRRRPRRTLG